MKITCCNARPSTTDVDLAVDVDVLISFAEDEGEVGYHTLSGSVTLVHNPDNASPRGLIGRGDKPDDWVSRPLLKGIYANSWDDGVWQRETLQEIEAAALACAVTADLV